MANWQDELESLLASFDVTLEASAADRQAAADGPDEYLLARLEPGDSLVAPGVEVIAVRSEVEAMVRQVAGLVRSGSIDSALREDVAFVLRALARPDGVMRSERSERCVDADPEWDIDSAAAILRFCRIVLRLTQAQRRLG
jgi:hypothetical protein